MERQHRALEAKTVYIELIGELERRAVDALDTAVAEIGDAAVVVSLKRAHGTRWNALLALADLCAKQRASGRVILLSTSRTVRTLLRAIDPSLTWLKDGESPTFRRHVIIAQTKRAAQAASAT